MNDLRIQSICLMVLAGIAGAFALEWQREALVPFAFALLMTIGLDGIAHRAQKRWGWSRRRTLGCVLVGGVLLVGAIGEAVASGLHELGSGSARYAEAVDAMSARVKGLVFDESAVAAGPASALPLEPLAKLGGVVESAGSALIDLASQSTLVLLFVAFLLIGRERGDPGATWLEIESRVTGYLLTKSVLSLLLALLVGSVLALLGVPLAAAFGLLAGLMNFIPNIGALFSTLLPLPLLLTTPELSTLHIVSALALPASIHLAIGNLVEPKLMGESLDLHPVSVLLGLVFWGTLWGVVGVLMAAPLTAVVRILVDSVDPMRPLAEAMAGRSNRSASAA